MRTVTAGALALMMFLAGALILTAALLVVWRLAPLKVMALGSIFGLLRTQSWVK